MVEVRHIDVHQSTHDLMIGIPGLHQAADFVEHIDQRQSKRVDVHPRYRAIHDLEHG